MSAISPHATEIAQRVYVGVGCSSDETIGEELCTILPTKQAIPNVVAVRFTSKRVMLAIMIKLLAQQRPKFVMRKKTGYQGELSSFRPIVRIKTAPAV